LDGGWSEDSLRRATRTKALPKNAVIERKEFKTEINVSWPCIPVVKSGEQWSCKKKKFVVAITLVQRCYQ